MSNTTKEKWHPDILVTEALVKQCIQEQFADLTPIAEIECIGEGWDNKVYLINQKIIFRFPHREVATQLIIRENKVLSALQANISLDIPNPIYSGEPSEIYPYTFQGYKILAGDSGCYANLSVEQREQSIAPLAEFLYQLHQFQEPQALAMGAKYQVFDRTNLDMVLDTLDDHANKLVTRGIVTIDQEILQQEISIAKSIVLPDNKVLVHGDMHCRHLMFQEGKLTGVIDWGDVGINSPAVDLAVIFSFYPASAHAEFLKIYGEVDPQTWAYARFLGLYSAINLLLYGFDVGDELLVAETKGSILRINPDLCS